MSRYKAGPGPGHYVLPSTVGYEGHDFTRKRNPAYSMAHRTAIDSKKPGPAPYNIREKQTRFGNDHSPAFSFAGRTGVTARSNIPGPGTYAPEKCPPMKENRPPAYTLSGRAGDKKFQQSPGPNQYSTPSTFGGKVPDKPSPPAFSMGGRYGETKSFKSPGPAAYGTPKLGAYKKGIPEFSIAGRTGGVTGKTQSPGPGAYKSDYIPGKSPPQFSFGVKHSEYSPPLHLEEDDF